MKLSGIFKIAQNFPGLRSVLLLNFISVPLLGKTGRRCIAAVFK